MKIKELCLQKQTKIPAKKRWIFFIGFFLLLIALFVTTHNDSFYKKSIVKVTKVTEEFLRKEKGPNGEIENYSRQEITSISRNGENKGKKVILVNDYSSTGYKTEKYKKLTTLYKAEVGEKYKSKALVLKHNKATMINIFKNPSPLLVITKPIKRKKSAITRWKYTTPAS